MPETYEKEGIIYFKEPYKTSGSEWVLSHLDCDSLITQTSFDESQDEDVAYIRCYAKNEAYNDRLRSYVRPIELKEENLGVLCAFSSLEVNCIDAINIPA